MPESLSKKDSDTDVFRWVLRNFFESLFLHRASVNGCFWIFSQLGNKQQNWKQLFRASYDANPLNLIGWPSESSVKRIKPCLNYLKKTYQILRSNFFWSFSSFFFVFWFLVPYFLLHSEKLSKLASAKHENQNQAFVSFTWPLKELLDRKIKLSPYDVHAFTWKFVMRTSSLRLPYNRILAQHLLWISSVNIKIMYRNRPYVSYNRFS